jgi:hypothetical protein
MCVRVSEKERYACRHDFEWDKKETRMAKSIVYSVLTNFIFFKKLNLPIVEWDKKETIFFFLTIMKAFNLSR